MSSERLQVCFQALSFSGELVLTSAYADSLDDDPLRCAWAAAEADAALAYDAWRSTPDRASFAVYRRPPTGSLNRTRVPTGASSSQIEPP
jgi:hypothetical protein